MLQGFDLAFRQVLRQIDRGEVSLDIDTTNIGTHQARLTGNRANNVAGTNAMGVTNLDPVLGPWLIGMTSPLAF